MHTNAPQRNSDFALQALVIFALTLSVVLLLEIAESSGVILPYTEDGLRFTIASALMLSLAYLARKATIPTSAKRTMALCALLVVSHFGLQLVENVVYFDEIPLIGENSQWKHLTSKVIVGGWTCSIFYLSYVLIAAIERSNEQLHRRKSELQSLNKELRKTKQQVIQSERLAAVGQLASGVAHELHNALTPVSIYTEMLLDGDTLPDQSVRSMCNATQHAVAVISQLQDFAQPHKESSEYRDVVDMSEIVLQSVQLTKPKWHDIAIKEGRSIKLEMNLGCGCWVAGDLTELKQVIMNLLVNAIESFDNGTINVFTQVSGRVVQIDVIDSGNGMSADQQAHCFEPFFSSKPSGTGLGLSVCYGIIVQHMGQLSVHQTTERGTVMRILLPLAAANEAASIDQPNIPKGAGHRILYVDDDESVRNSTVALLNSIGYVAESCTNGREVMPRLRKAEYDLLITDFGMSGFSGWDVVQIVKTTYPNLPVGVVSGWSSTEILKRFNQDHRPDFVAEKPLDKAKIASAIAASIYSNSDIGKKAS